MRGLANVQASWVHSLLIVFLINVVSLTPAMGQTAINDEERQPDFPGLDIQAVVGWDGRVETDAPVPVSFLISNQSNEVLEGQLILSERHDRKILPEGVAQHAKHIARELRLQRNPEEEDAPPLRAGGEERLVAAERLGGDEAERDAAAEGAREPVAARAPQHPTDPEQQHRPLGTPDVDADGDDRGAREEREHRRDGGEGEEDGHPGPWIAADDPLEDHEHVANGVAEDRRLPHPDDEEEDDGENDEASVVERMVRHTDSRERAVWAMVPRGHGTGRSVSAGTGATPRCAPRDATGAASAARGRRALCTRPRRASRPRQGPRSARSRTTAR